MNRRDFLGQSLATPLAGLAVLAAACGDDGNGSTLDAGPPSCLQHGTTVVIAANHGHMLQVAIADIQAGVDKTYELTGGDHSHMVTITALQFGMLSGDQPISVRSTVEASHTHPITIGCR